MKSNISRRYLGVTITAQNYREILDKEGRQGINFHTKHLKSYLRGYSTFTFGYEKDEEGRNIRPKSFVVQKQLIVPKNES